MIKNNQQYEIAKRSIEKHNNALEEYKKELELNKTNPVLKDAYINAFNSSYTEIVNEINVYEKLIDKQTNKISFCNIEQLGPAIIKSRILIGWTQKDLAERIGLYEQQIQRYEQDNYQKTKLERVVQIARELGIKVFIEKALHKPFQFDRFNLGNSTKTMSSINRTIQDRKYITRWGS